MIFAGVDVDDSHLQASALDSHDGDCGLRSRERGLSGPAAALSGSGSESGSDAMRAIASGALTVTTPRRLSWLNTHNAVNYSNARSVVVLDVVGSNPIAHPGETALTSGYAARSLMA